ncbi:carbohydrate ABC transporter permease [Paenibacillus nasutitermitis]|uniref:ABC transporter permease protein YtcP n=1 Tax=Paenibacillus nasutitermitis TaxID=1652958 RepID=A0A916Z296_9BACL|nr:carbohydrate ABC transporter permease [Paenibacillus nasutitermitis]GGD72532.1 putative ABC transporter permease protein YtcP [Paenibacillus nasutitermitis]
MVGQASLSRTLFQIVNNSFLFLFSLLAILPFVNVLALSLSNKTAAAAGLVKLWPVGFTWNSYKFVFLRDELFTALGISVERVVLGTAISMLLTILVAYPLSKEESAFPGRTLYAWLFVFTILFNGGLIPWYMTIKMTGILDTIWALVLPGAVQVFNCILLLNFFRGLPKALEEAAFVDGASHWTIIWRIFVPLSAPALATVTLFTIVGHWNSWFDGLILMNSPTHYPLQSYLQTVVVKLDTSAFANIDPVQAKLLSEISDRTVKAAQIFMASVPILLIYPFLQKYFMAGIVLGSVKE